MDDDTARVNTFYKTRFILKSNIKQWKSIAVDVKLYGRVEEPGRPQGNTTKWRQNVCTHLAVTSRDALYK